MGQAGLGGPAWTGPDRTDPNRPGPAGGEASRQPHSSAQSSGQMGGAAVGNATVASRPRWCIRSGRNGRRTGSYLHIPQARDVKDTYLSLTLSLSQISPRACCVRTSPKDAVLSGRQEDRQSPDSASSAASHAQSSRFEITRNSPHSGLALATDEFSNSCRRGPDFHAEQPLLRSGVTVRKILLSVRLPGWQPILRKALEQLVNSCWTVLFGHI